MKSQWIKKLTDADAAERLMRRRASCRASGTCPKMEQAPYRRQACGGHGGGGLFSVLVPKRWAVRVSVRSRSTRSSIIARRLLARLGEFVLHSAQLVLCRFPLEVSAELYKNRSSSALPRSFCPPARPKRSTAVRVRALVLCTGMPILHAFSCR